MTEARADIRAAIRRLMVAARRNDIVVEVPRRDLEVLLAAVATGRRTPAGPDLHPEQR